MNGVCSSFKPNKYFIYFTNNQIEIDFLNYEMQKGSKSIGKGFQNINISTINMSYGGCTIAVIIVFSSSITRQILLLAKAIQLGDNSGFKNIIGDSTMYLLALK